MRMGRNAAMGTLLVMGALALASVPALALTPYDVPTISCGTSGLHEITIKICGGASGAPAGVTLQWKTVAEYEISGWSDVGLCKLSLSGQPSLQHPDKSRWELIGTECEDIKIGDINFDETGVSGEGCGLDPLECGTEYVFRVFAHAGRGFGRSDFSANLTCSTLPCQPGGGCTFTQGYWKTHGPAGCNPSGGTNVWPGGGLTLGTVAYTDAQICSILNLPAGGNGLVSLAHQLIAAKFNAAGGATCAASLIVDADALIGSLVVPPVGSGSLAPSATSELTGALDDFNNGIGCADHCGDAAQRLGASGAEKAPWGKIKIRYR